MPKHWYNNGKVNKLFDECDVPEGFVLGMREYKVSKESRERALEKRKKTCLEKYGVGNPMQSKDVQEQMKQNSLKKWGTEYPSQSLEVKNKVKKTCLEKYGTDCSLHSKESIVKKKKTYLEKYGVDNPLKSDIIRNKIKQTNIERYGVENPFQAEVFKEKSKQSSLEHYGTEHPMQSRDGMEIYKKAMREKYGVEYFSQSPVIQERIKKTNLERYGSEYVLGSEYIKEKSKQTSLKKYGTEYPMQSEEIKSKVSNTIQERYGMPWYCMSDAARSYNNLSSVNKMFLELLNEYNVSNHEREFRIKRYSYDFKVGNTLIEVDPYPTHNTLWSPYTKSGGNVNEMYHKKKSQTAEEQGYQVIHIFDWDNPEKIIQNLLLPKERVYARKTKVFGIDKSEANNFLNEHHLQGTCNGQQVCLGLRDEHGELISLMTFGKPRYNKNYQYELLRYCSSKAVIGGAEKLFKHFIKTYSPESIISYCDRSKFRGDIYSKLGFTKLREGSPSKHWYSTKDGRHITDNLLRQRGFDQLFNTSYGKGTSNEELMIAHNFVPIYDCGQDTYVWENQ